MAAPSSVVRHRHAPEDTDAAPARSPLIFAAPAAAALAGMAAEWLDVGALRYPLLLVVGLGVLVTAWALLVSRRDARTFALTVALGMVTWAAAETLYVALHTMRGEPFDAERFGPQWAQALGLIGVHGIFLGAPTGIVAAILLHSGAVLRRARRQ